MSGPLISVLLPVYNAEKYVRQTVESILNQSHAEFEFIIVDDGSSDRSAQIVGQLEQQDRRIEFTRQDNRGMAATLNDMLERACGEFIARIDADDIAMPTRFAEQISFLEKHPACVVVGSAVLNIDQDGDPLSVEEFPATHSDIENRMLSGGGGIIHPATMIRRQAMLDAGGFALDCPVVEDQKLWLRMALNGELANLPQPLTKYRVHSQNMTFAQQRLARSHLLAVLEEARRDRGLDSRLTIESPPPIDSEWERTRMWAWSAIEHGYLQTARKHARRLCWERKFNRAAWVLYAFAHFPRTATWLRRVVRRTHSDQ